MIKKKDILSTGGQNNEPKTNPLFLIEYGNSKNNRNSREKG